MTWKPVLQVLAVVAGSAVWVQLIGSVDMWARFNKIGIAHTSTVSLLPRDLLFATGVRALTLPVLAGVSACGALVLVHAQVERRARRKEPDAKVERNPAGARPPGLRLIFLAILAISWLLVVGAPLTTGVTALLLCVVLVGAALIYFAVLCTSGFGSAAAAVLAGTAVLGGILGLVLQFVAPTRLDVAVAIRKGDPPISGFYVGRTGDAIYILTATQPGVASQTQPPFPTTLCDRTRAPTPGRHPDCYVQQVVGVRTSDVVKFAIGPRSVEVNLAGYDWARVLAEALLRADTGPPAASAGPGG